MKKWPGYERRLQSEAKMKGKAHPKEVKALAIAELLTGNSATDVAAKYKLPRESVRNWKLAFTAEQLAEVSRNTEGRRDDLICEYAETALGSLTAQAQQAARVNDFETSTDRNLM